MLYFQIRPQFWIAPTSNKWDGGYKKKFTAIVINHITECYAIFDGNL